MVFTTYKEKLRRLSLRLVELQRPIRILDALKWDPSIEQEFRRNKGRELPAVNAEHYQKNCELGFDPEEKLRDFQELEQAIESELGADDALGQWLSKNARQYVDVIRMLQARGTAQFSELSRKLYGSPRDPIFDQKLRLYDVGHLLYEILNGFDAEALGPPEGSWLEAEEVVNLLNARFRSYFTDHSVQARLSEGIIADAAAGGDYVNIRKGARFHMRDVDILEVHEGWVHVGTTQNGANQHVLKSLAKGAPRVSATQEGLAVLLEIIMFRSNPTRARHVNNRLLAIEKAEQGANFLELVEFFRAEGYDENDCFISAQRVCRGGLVGGGAPFTKDISYCKGFVENYNFMRATLRAGRPELIPFLFTGKINVEDVPLMYLKHQEGVVDAPTRLPPMFRDARALAVWLSFSSFLNQIDFERIQEHYDKLMESVL